MPTHAPLLIDLTGVARLAGVRRPVASVWRTRFAGSGDPFPHVVSEASGRPLFDAMAVAQWLERTGHGNNPDAIADAAASAAPGDFDVTNAQHVAAVDALLTLRAASGEPVGGYGIEDLHRRASLVDPDDTCLLAELSLARATWTDWADLLADAAYSPLEASRILERRHSATRASEGSAGPFTAEAEDLIVAMAHALAATHDSELVLNSGVAPSVAARLTRVRDDVDLRVLAAERRDIRRRLLCEGIALPLEAVSSDGPRLLVERLPTSTARLAARMLHAIDEVVLGMRDQDRSLVVAPAAVLTEGLSASDARTRADILRSGRVRAIAKLPAGLVASAPREALALWVLGREMGDVPAADRFTAVADLTGSTLTPATRTDLIHDVLAAMGSAFDVWAHSFRFTRLIRTSSLLAARGALVPTPRVTRGTGQPTEDLPALLDQARAELGADAPSHAPAAVPAPAVPAASIETLLTERHLRVLPGTRVTRDEFSDSGLIVVGAHDLDEPGRIGQNRVDPLEFAARHPSARLTVAGDVVFRTSPTPKAWVDLDGSKVVVHPARVLRVDPADPGGLVPALVAADIDRSPGGAGAWRRWMLRRVSVQAAAPLAAALSEVATQRHALTRRIEALDTYAELLAAGVASGTVSFTDNAADAASDSL